MSLTAHIKGMGVWGPGFRSVSDLTSYLANPDSIAADDSVTAPPKPAAIPARERRRSPLSVKLAVEVASQACEAAGIAASEPACVFASGMGDTDITDYMCRILAGPEKMVSPTRFHNSVHNAPAGYWTISTQCQQAATSVAGFTYTFSVALLEAMVQVATAGRPVLLVIDDVATPAPMRDINPIDHGFAVALLLTSAHAGADSQSATIVLDLHQRDGEWPRFTHANLASLYASNPAARSLALLEALLLPPHQSTRLFYPLSEHSGVDLRIVSRTPTAETESMHAP